MRVRIVALTVLAAALAVSLFAVPLAAVVVRNALAEERATLERLADLAALTVQEDLTDDEMPDRLPDVPGETRLALYDDEGVRILGDGPGRDDGIALRAVRGAVTRSDTDDDLVVGVPVTGEGDVYGVVRASISRAQVYSRLASTWLAMGGLGAGALAAAWLIAHYLARRLARPLEELSESARRLGEGDFSVTHPSSAIPEIDAVGGSINVTARRLDELLARERAFSADASHQLRTPLAGWRLEMEEALDSPEADLRRAILRSLRSADRLERTLDELLTLARDTRGSIAERLDLGSQLAEVEHVWRPRLAAGGRVLMLTLEPQLPAAQASAAAVRQILTVLLDNATTHGAGTVRVAARDVGGALAVDVADEGDGIGMPDDELFARRQVGTGTGSGIGLALARRLAEAEGGRLVLSERHPPVFTLLVPSAESGARPAPALRGAVEPVSGVAH